ncbi:MAG: chaperone modulator CbpM [Bacteroidetes bacterium]|nr:chaperone modulator CbpM [Bacteroidota bacterium]MBS1975145.1 chaperone modulator CbpM [Bacteroidota bacterium]
MQTENLIPLKDFCTGHSLQLSFIETLQHYDLIEVTTIEQALYIHDRDLPKLEQLTRLHQDLDINLEGIEAIANLLQQMDDMHEEIIMLRNKLNAYKNL